MPTIPLFQGGSYTADSPNWAADRTLNLFTEVGESGSTKSPMRLRGSPGLAVFATLPTSPVRGIFVNEYLLFAVGGSRLYSISQAGAWTDLGDVGDDASHSPAQLFPNGGQLFIVSAGLAYLHTGTELLALNLGTLEGTVSTFGTAVEWVAGDNFDAAMVGRSVIINGVTYTVASVRADNKHLNLTTSTGGPFEFQWNLAFTATLPLTARTGAFLDGYFIATRPNSKQFNLSKLYDGKVWDALDFGIKEGYPDNILSMIADHEELWLLGSETTEVWRNTGNALFPFERDQAAFIHQGIGATYTLNRLNNGVAWLGGDTRGRITAWRAQGFVPVRISTHAVEQAWRGYSEVSDAIGFTYRMDGHEFWQIGFPTAGATWVYDALSSQWHERDSLDGGAYGMHRARCHGYIWGKHLVGDFANGKIYQMSPTLYSDAGVPIRRLRQAPHLSDEQIRHFFHRLQLDMETGSAVANPEMELSWSDDGGHTWSTPIVVAAGELTDYSKRVIWRRLGDSRDRVFRITSTAAIPHTWINALVDVSKGTS
jgi:hypothetical protein